MGLREGPEGLDYPDRPGIASEVLASQEPQLQMLVYISKSEKCDIPANVSHWGCAHQGQTPALLPTMATIIKVHFLLTLTQGLSAQT